MKKILKLLLSIVVICAIVYFAPKLVHKCDGCESWVVGPGYKANVIANVISDDNQTLCRECAEENHKIEIALGKSVDNYKNDIFDFEDILSKFE